MQLFVYGIENAEGVVVSIPQAVGTVATTVPPAYTNVIPVSIPQAVGTVATKPIGLITREVRPVSIPQAVGTVATSKRSIILN